MKRGCDPSAPRELLALDPASWEVRSGQHVENVLRALRTLLDVSGFSLQKVTRVLASHECVVDVPRVLRGKLDLKVSHVLDVCRVIGLHPVELFRIGLKEPSAPSPLLERAAALLRAGTPQPRLPVLARAEDPSRLEALEQRLAGLQREVEELRRRLPGTPAVTPEPH